MSQDDLLKNWDVAAPGVPRFDQIVDIAVAAVNPHHVVVRLDYVTSQEHLDQFHDKKARPHRVQLAMPPETAAQLGELLLRYSTGLQSMVPGRDKQN